MDTNENEIFSIVVIAMILLVVIVGLFVVVAIYYHNKMMKMNRKRIDKEMELLEAERNRIAEELHNELGPSLATIKSSLECIEITDKRQQPFIQQASDYIDSSIALLRRKTSVLMPVSLLNKGLATAISAFIEKLNKGNLCIHWEHYGIPVLAEDRSIHIFRVVQEIIYNTLKHAKAMNLYLTIAVNEEKLFIESSDDGIGFEGQPGVDSLGLAILQRRVGLLDGQMTLKSARGKGTQIIIKIPLSKQSKQQYGFSNTYNPGRRS